MVMRGDTPAAAAAVIVSISGRKHSTHRSLSLAFRVFRSLGMRTSFADRYILQEILAPFMLGVGAFLVILVGDILYTLAEFIASRQVSAGTVVELLIYKLPAILVITFPVSTLVGIVLGLGRLAKDREVQAMRLAGFSLMRIFGPGFAVGPGAPLATFALHQLVPPWA